MTIFDVLKQDHENVRALLSALDARADPVTLEAALRAVRTAVLIHTRAEEDTLYSALQAIDETEERAEHAVDEHEAVEALLGHLEALEVGSADWHGCVARLHAALLHHIADEEDGLFKAAASVLDEASLARLGDAFVAERQRLRDDGAPALARKTG